MTESGMIDSNFKTVPRNILVISRNWIGDAVGNTAAIRNIRFAFPQSMITVLCPERCVPVFRADPDVDAVIAWRKGHGKMMKWGLRWFIRLRKKRFDTVFIFHESRSRALLAYLLGAKNRIGYRNKGRDCLLTLPVEKPENAMHFVDSYCSLVEYSGIKIVWQRYVWEKNLQGRVWVRHFLKSMGLASDQPYIVIHPAANRFHRQWLPENFARVADLCNKELGLRVLFTGRSSDQGIISEIMALTQIPCLDISGKTDLESFAALASNAVLYVGVDTGATHLAAATGVRVIAIFGATDPDRVGPYHTNGGAIIQHALSCRHPQCDLNCRENPRYRCMVEIKPDEVMDTIKLVLSSNLQG